MHCGSACSTHALRVFSHHVGTRSEGVVLGAPLLYRRVCCNVRATLTLANAKCCVVQGRDDGEDILKMSGLRRNSSVMASGVDKDLSNLVDGIAVK